MADSSSRKSWVQYAVLSIFLVCSGGFFVYYSGSYKDVPGCLLFHDTDKCRQRERSIAPNIAGAAISNIFEKSKTNHLQTANCVANMATRNPRLKLLNKFFKCKYFNSYHSCN